MDKVFLSFEFLDIDEMFSKFFAIDEIFLYGCFS